MEDDLIFAGAYIMALIAGGAWFAIIGEIKRARKERIAEDLVRVARAKINAGRTAQYAGAELHFRASQAGCLAEATQLWHVVEMQEEEKRRVRRTA